MNDVADQLQNFKDNLDTSLWACVLTVVKLSKKSDDWFEKLLLENKALRDDRFHSPPVQNNISAIRSRHF